MAAHAFLSQLFPRGLIHSIVIEFQPYLALHHMHTIYRTFQLKRNEGELFYLSFVIKHVGPIVARVNASLVDHNCVQLVLKLLQRFVRVHVLNLTVYTLNGRLQTAYILFNLLLPSQEAILKTVAI
jgi:hypothetical protein